jgi:diguanylate cyclase (GGDEF)-like protein
LNRSLAATVASTGGRLAAVLLPLAALAVLHALPSFQKGAPLPWLAPGIAATAAVAAGLALLVAVVVSLESGRMRDLGDAAGLGMLAVTFAVLAMGAAGGLGLGIGMASAAVAFAAGSTAGGRTLTGRRDGAIGIIVVLVLIEACLAATLLAGSSGGSLTAVVLGVAAVLLAIAAATSLNDPTRAIALGIAASGATALALAGPTDNERLVGAAAVAIVAVVLGWSLVVNRLHRATTTLDAPAHALAPAPMPFAEPEYDESARLTRELRATLDDLIAARRTIGLQRAEIERASTFDPLTGLPSRGPTLDRLRTEAAEARRYSHPVTVVLLDIDGFATLNHEHGLSVGDAVLREVALRLRLRIREADALGRIGGDAFLAVLPHTDEGGAATFAQAVLDRGVDRPFTTDRGEMTIRLSLGIALMRPGMTLSGEELLAAAEEALASAKAAGGNRIAFDRLHGLARLDRRRSAGASAPDEPTEGPAANEVDATR